MMLVETAGPFQLIDHDTRTLIRYEGYTVVMKTSFVEKWAMLGQLKFVSEVGPDATDAEWREYVKESDGDLTLALESFKAAFPPPGSEPVDGEAPVRRPRRKKE